MCAKAANPETDSETSSEALASTGKISFLRRLLTKRWISAILVLSVVIHGLLLMCWPAAVRAKPEIPSEVELGEFRFINNEKNARLARAQFKLHVSLLLGTEKIGGNRLAEKKFLVQQGIEELLRQAHAADFDDPTLSELKRQIQEKVNEAVEMRTVEAVIITRLETDERVQPAKASVASYDPPAKAAEAGRAAPVAPGILEAVPPAADATQPEKTGPASGAAG